MKSTVRQRALIAVAVLAVLAAVLIAVLGSGGSRSRPSTAATTTARTLAPGDLEVAASYIGLSRPQLRGDLRRGKTLAEIAQARSGRSATGLLDALVAAKEGQIAAAVRSGKLSRQQQSARLRGLRRRAEAEVHRARNTAIGSIRYLSVTTGYLGLTAKQLHDKRRAGRSFAEIADATAGKSAAGLIGALVRDRQASLKQAVSAGAIRRSEAARVESGLRDRVTRQVDRRPRVRG